jgi:circadian clock protein KaiC
MARNETDRLSSGTPGLDEVLDGGFARDRVYLLEGVPGSGKTTLAMQFLMEGARRGESVLYVTLSESVEDLRMVAVSHGWTLDGVELRELVASEDLLERDQHYTMFHPAEIELGEATKSILSDVERLDPSRVVFDSLSELRLLAGNPLRYRRQILALNRFFVGRKCTVLLLDDLAAEQVDLQVHSVAHGVLRLEQLYPEYGADRRRVIVRKFRGSAFRGGYHDFVIRRGGISVYPRLAANQHEPRRGLPKVSSGIRELDALLGGGIECGTSTLIVGAPGTGKSSIAAQFVTAAAARGQRAAMFIFDESANTLLTRADGLGIDLRQRVDEGAVTIQTIDPAELSPGEFIHAVRVAVTERDVSVIVIDSLNGYLNAMPEERFLVIQLHELLSFLGQAGIATIMIGAHQGLIGSQMSSPVDVSYLADAVILMRYFEAEGEIRQAVSVVKKRGGAHERSIREFKLEPGRIAVGPPLKHYRGVLTGVPVPEGEPGR